MATHYIDPVDGSDATPDDTDINTPRKTWPSTLVQDDTYAGKGGEETFLTDKINVLVTGVTLTSYGEGQHKLDGLTTQTTDLTRNIRVGANNLTLSNIEITGPADGGAGNGIQVVAGVSGLTVDNGVVFTGPSVARDQNSKAIDYQGDAPFDIGNFTVNGFNNGVEVKDSAVDMASIHDCVITLNGHVNQAASSAGIGIGSSLAAIDWEKKLFIYNIKTSGWSENGIDLAGATNVIVKSIELYSPSGLYATPAAIFLGTPANDASDNTIEDFHIHTMSTGNGIHARGGVSCKVTGGILENLNNGIYNGTAGSNNNVYGNIKFKNMGTGITNTDNTTGTELYNSVFIDVTTPINEITGVITYYNCDIFGGSISGTPVDGGGNITDDPLELPGGAFPLNSPCIGAGAKYWTGANPQGYGGEPISDFDIDIGHIQSTFGPFHPKNL